MAQLDKHNRFIGGLGDLVFRQVNGKTIVQMKPGKNGVKQTKQTKLSSSDFGTASSTTKCLSMTLRRLFLTYYDHQMFNRFRKTVYQAMLSNTEIPKGKKDLWQGEISLLDGFEFNLSSLYTDYCSLGIHCSLTPTQEIKLETEVFNPKTQLKWPEKTHRAEVCYLISTYAKDTYTPLIEEVFKINVTPFSSPLAAQSFITPSLASNCLVLVSSCIWFFREDALIGAIATNHKDLHPAKIEKAFRILS
ncbi:hypothetical protein RBU60_04910 [Mesonia sp. MT50]|uniref:Uncharacterized protein n=1 Tax=Mesonia profundi TaxID=3070998 RepID=A0ABU0ZZL9_9FLAO|nr:hypothetical protein [Mesonia profundi]MDQ7916906.1 hypothetical protein [Mesonia profundi]